MPSTRSKYLAILIAASCTMPLGTATAGSIEGHVRFTGATVSPKKLAVTVDRYVCGKDKDAEDLVLSSERGIRNAVVWLESPPQGPTGQSPPVVAQIDQKECVFIPRVVVVATGGTVEFLNSDRLLHNIHSFSTENPRVNRTQPKGRTIPITLSKPEIIRVACDLHPWMRSWVVVADHPFYAVTGTEGEFTLTNVPPGNYTIKVWQESLGTVTKEITVGGEETTSAQVEMARP